MVLADLVGRYAQTFGKADTPEYRSKLLIRLQIANDPRVERYWQLLATINGWPAPPALASVFDWFIQALQHHPSPCPRVSTNGSLQPRPRPAQAGIALQASIRQPRKPTWSFPHQHPTRTARHLAETLGVTPCYARVPGGRRGGDPSMACKRSEDRVEVSQESPGGD
jgi:hypothetical protein